MGKVTEWQRVSIQRLAEKSVYVATNVKQDGGFKSNELDRSEFEDKFGYPILKYDEGINFFSEFELTRFSKISGEHYSRNDPLAQKRKHLFWPTFARSNKWADLLKAKLPNYEVINNRQWQNGQTFRSYTWHKIYRPADRDKKIFFTVGVSGETKDLVVKLDCMREARSQSEVLSAEKIQRFKNFRSGQDWRRKIHSHELALWNWQRLINHSSDFIHSHKDLYDEAIRYVHEIESGQLNSKIGSDYKGPVQAPNRIRSRVPTNHTFNGRDINWEQEFKRTQRIGFNGEQFILNQEKQKLIKCNLSDKANLVEKVSDGKGYDILSFDKSGNQIFIEVKTTTGPIDEPFYFSENEKAFLEENNSNYWLYRVFNLNRINRKAKYYKKCGRELLNEATFSPISFEVSIQDDE